jgi:hypothetical protein
MIYVENCIVDIAGHLHQISLFSLRHEEMDIALDTFSQSHPILDPQEWKKIALQASKLNVEMESHYWRAMTDNHIDRASIVDMAADILVSLYSRELKRHSTMDKKTPD